MNPKILRAIVQAPLDDGETGGTDTGSAGTMAKAKEKITNTARDTAARLKSTASETASRAKAEAQRVASEKKESTANRIGGYGSALHESANSLEPQDPNIAWATHRVAERIDRLADYVRRSDFNDLRNDLENVARRHPLAFFGGLFLGGLVLGNVLTARPEKDDAREDDDIDFDEPSSSENSLAAPDGSGL